jgi:hypothetical protein
MRTPGRGIARRLRDRLPQWLAIDDQPLRGFGSYAKSSRLPAQARDDWTQLSPLLFAVRDVWTVDRPAVFGSAKDRPVLFTAAAWAEVLLTLDRGDFGALMGTGFYGLDILTPGDFLERERAAGRLK